MVLAALPSSPLFPLLFLVMGCGIFFASTRAAMIRRAAEQRTQFTKRVPFQRPRLSVEANERLSRVILWIMGVLCLLFVGTWIVQAILGNLE